MHDFFESTGGAEAVATDLFVGVANAGACRPSINVRPDDARGLWLEPLPHPVPGLELFGGGMTGAFAAVFFALGSPSSSISC